MSPTALPVNTEHSRISTPHTERERERERERDSHKREAVGAGMAEATANQVVSISGAQQSTGLLSGYAAVEPGEGEDEVIGHFTTGDVDLLIPIVGGSVWWLGRERERRGRE